MKIARISAYQIDLPLRKGSYKWSGGKSVEVLDSTVVEVETDSGSVGYGEVCPLGSSHLPAYGAGVRAGMKELAPHLIGMSATELGPLNHMMDNALTGHAYVKSGIDMACWDLLGKSTATSVCDWMGGAFGEDFVLHRAISQESPEAMSEEVARFRHEGYRGFRLNVGDNVDVDIQRIKKVAAELHAGERLVADANTGWLMHQAAQVVCAVREVDVYIQQPCSSYEECLSIRQRTDHPFVMDESIQGIPELFRACNDRAMDVVNIKISKFGGLTKARLARDLCVSLGMAMTIEDSWGSDIVTAAVASLAHSTPTNSLFSSTDFNSYVTVSIAEGAPQRNNGRLAASTQPGLGIQPRMDILGNRVLEIS